MSRGLTLLDDDDDDDDIFAVTFFRVNSNFSANDMMK